MEYRLSRVLLLSTIILFSSAASLAGPVVTPAFDPANFSHPVQNEYFPLAPGTTSFYAAEEEDGLYRTEVTVTSQTRQVNGIPAIVVHDVVWLDVADGPTVLIEDTMDWYAPDNSGNVWYMGEETVEHLYDEAWTPIGTTTEGSWEAGVGGALPGFIMPSNPEPGFAYRQEFSEGVAEDLARIARLNARVSVPYGSFADVLVTKEWTTLEPGAVERKYYARGVGLVLVEELHGQRTVREELVAIVQ